MAGTASWMAGPIDSAPCCMSRVPRTARLTPKAAQTLLRSVLASLASPKTEAVDRTALLDWLHWWESSSYPLTRSSVEAWREALAQRGLAPSSVNQRLSAVRLFFFHAGEQGLLPKGEAADLIAVRNVKLGALSPQLGLTAGQAGRLLRVPDRHTSLGKRNRALLAVMLGCGLRREELVHLEVRHLRQREKRWVLLNLGGHGTGGRTVPLPSWVKQLLDAWLEAAGISQGLLFCPLRKNGRPKTEKPLSNDAVYSLVKGAGSAIGKPDLTPNDLRQTCAQLCRQAGGDLEQIQFLLGHASVQTTARFLRTKQELRQAVNDRVKIQVKPGPNSRS